MIYIFIIAQNLPI